MALALIVLPIVALGVRVPWPDLGDILAAPETRELLRVTLGSAVLATIIAVALGTPLALWMRNLRKGAALARLLVLLPLALPPVVAGLALSAFIGRRGIAAPLLDDLNWQFAFAFPGVVAAHVFIALPFVVITLDAALRQLDPEITDSAAAVGISPGTATRRIVLPAIAPALVTAAGLAFARSLGEFGTTLTFAGSMPGVTRTMPLGIYLAREIDQSVAYGLSAILVGLAVLTLAAAALPTLIPRRTPPQRARATGAADIEALRRLTLPDGAPEPVRIGNCVFPAGATTALIGPNGAGKTTLVGRIAGRLTSDADVAVGNARYDGPGANPVPAHRRGVVLLTQNPGLPPTTTARGAIAMVTGDAARAAELLAAAGLAELADVPVGALSGGQASQVSLLRALAARPRVLLLDEPFAAIDVASARQWRHLLRATAADRTTVLVTHNALDIATLADHVAVMERGEVVSLTPTAGAFARPATGFAARLVGVNRVTGTATDDATLASPAGNIAGTAATPIAPGTPAVAVFPPAAAALGGDLRATVSAVDIAPTGDATVELTLSESESITLPLPRADALDGGLEPGQAVTFSVDPAQTRLYLAD
nr:ATP-binding cassette domain-containing protein [Corynebacterium stercoris]